MRLNKYLAKSGIASRRKSDELIKMATTTVNNEIILDKVIFNINLISLYIIVFSLTYNGW